MVTDRTDAKTAVCELSKLIKDLHSAGLNTEVRKGHEHLLLVFVQVPRKYLESAVYQSR
jgi:anoctamin-10